MTAANMTSPSHFFNFASLAVITFAVLAFLRPLRFLTFALFAFTQNGEYLEEDDIERFSDAYGR